MKIIKNKKRILITIAILGVVIVLTALYLFEKKSEREKLDYERGPQTQLPHESFIFHEAKNGTKDTATNMEVIVSSPMTENGITYITKTYFSHDIVLGGKGGITYIEIIAGLPKESMKKINEGLRKPLNNSIFGNPADEKALSTLRNTYKEQYIGDRDKGKRIPNSTIDTMTYEEVGQALITYFGYYQNTGEEILLLNNKMVSVKVVTSSYEGGAHVDEYGYAINYDTATGNAFEFKDVFISGKMDKKAIEKTFNSYMQYKAITMRNEGGDPLRKGDFYDESQLKGEVVSADYITAGFDEAGIVVISLDRFQHHANGEDIIYHPVVIPYYFFKEYLKPGLFKDALTIHEKDLLGNWTIHIVDQVDDPECKNTPKEIGLCDPNDAEQIQFSMVNGKREFNSWIHNVPEQAGCAWALKGETITISCKDSSSVNDSKIISLSTANLTIDAGGGFSPGVYYRSH